MATKRGSHCVYDTKYHLVWAPKYRKWILRGEIRDRAKEFPRVKEQLWGGEFWDDGYFARTVGDEVTAEVIKKHIRFHEQRAKRPEQMQLF